jgi:hypothetical protein
MPYLDTQILVDGALRRNRHKLEAGWISSIVANEFLGVQSAVPTKANYYVPLLGVYNNLVLRPAHPVGKAATDAVMMDFGGEFDTLIEYGSLAIANAINAGDVSRYSAAVAFMPKPQQRILRRRFQFILDHGLKCTPLGPRSISLGQRLLREFMAQNNLKSHFRNTWNDILIASTAVCEARPLITKDSLLARFIATRYSSTHEVSAGLITLEFPAAAPTRRRANRESKGYVNRWQVRFTKPR